MTVHVYPINDLVVHSLTGTDCICGPDIEYLDPDTGSSYADALVNHHSLDGRELREKTNA